jgi:hypothetical protein
MNITNKGVVTVNLTEALTRLANLPGGPFDEGGQLGVKITFSGRGDLEAFEKALADDCSLVGTYVNGTGTVNTLMALQAPQVLELMVKCGFVIEDVVANIIPLGWSALVLTGPPSAGRWDGMPALKALMRSAEPGASKFPNLLTKSLLGLL